MLRELKEILQMLCDERLFAILGAGSEMFARAGAVGGCISDDSSVFSLPSD
jgi:hypothetical protein